MKDIRLKRLDLRNFKGMTFSFEPDGQDTDVFGANASGKTTLADAVSWLLFGKDSLGRSDFQIKNLNAHGEAEHGLDHSVEGTWMIDGIPVTLKKAYHEVWSKKRGSAHSTLTGNTTDHYIDGVPVKEGEYRTRIAEIAGDESIFRLLTSPTVFPALPWRQARSLLLDACGDVSDADVIATDAALTPLTELLKRYTVSKTPLDDLKKVVTGRRTEINREIDRIPVRIDEVTLGLPDIQGLNLSDLNARKLALEDFISACQLKLQGIDNGAGIAELSKEVQEIGFEIGQLQNTYYLEGMQHVTKLNARINEITSGRDAEERQVRGIKDEIIAKQARIASLEQELDNLRNKWTAVDAEEFKDSSIEDVCFACKQPLPPERVDAARTNALAHHNRDKAERLMKIETTGKELRAELDKNKEQIAELHGKLIERPDAGDNEITGLIAERDTFKTLAEDYSQIPGRAELLDRKANLERQIQEVRNGLSMDKEVIQKEVDDLNAQFTEVKEKVDRFARREQGEKRVAELKAEEKKLAKEYEELERQLFLIETFIKTKVSLLTDRINGMFEIVKFKLYDVLVNGGVEECCVATVGGVPYDSGLNSAARTQAGLDIIRTLQRHYGLSCPIWIDNRESCTAIPKMDCQVLSLFVSPEDKTLRVEKSSVYVKNWKKATKERGWLHEEEIRPRRTDQIIRGA